MSLFGKRVREKLKYKPESGLYVWNNKEYLFHPEEANDHYGKYRVALKEKNTGEKILIFYPHEYEKEDSIHYIHKQSIDGNEDFTGKIIRPASITKRGEWYNTKGQEAIVGVIHYIWNKGAKEILIQPSNKDLKEHYKQFGFQELESGQVLNSTRGITYMSLPLEELTEEYFAKRGFFDV